MWAGPSMVCLIFWGRLLEMIIMLINIFIKEPKKISKPNLAGLKA